MQSLSKSYPIVKKKKAIALAWICLFCAVVIPLVAIGDTLFGESKDYWTTITVVILWFPLWSGFAYVFFKWAKTAKLDIAENKIECDDIASLVGFSTPWENIDYVLASKMRLILFLKEPSKPITNLGQWAIKHNWINPKVIDLSSFIDHWKSGELRQDFERYAPNLFDDKGELKTNATYR
jgi:hypothetical protein